MFYADTNGMLHANGLAIHSSDGTEALIDGNNKMIDFSKFTSVLGKVKADNIELGDIDPSKNAIKNGTYFYWDGNGLKAIDPNDPTRYVLINSGGQQIKKGMIDVERSDGFKTIIGGKLNQSFDIQGSDPPHLVDAEVNGRFFQSTMTNGNGGTCNLYTFTRIARYVVFQVALMSSSYNQSTAILAQSGNENIWLGSASAFDTNEIVQNIVLDLGVPDGTVYALKLMLKSYSTNNTAYCRKVRAYQTDFPPS
jgi:hypothetical protein